MRAVAALILVISLGCIFNANGAFFSWPAHRDMFRQVAVFGILASGMTLVILTSGIDLAVGSVLGLSAVLFSILTIKMQMTAFAAIAICLATGAVLGALSGTLVSKLKIQPFMATLAMMVFARGLAKWISGGKKISQSVENEDGTFSFIDLPSVFEFLDQKIWNGQMSVVSLIFIGIALLGALFLTYHKFGRYFLAVGGNEEASKISGVPVDGIKILSYLVCGILAAVAGILQAVQEGQGDPEAGGSYELTAIAMVVIGGTSLMGGRGGLLLTIFGVLTIGYLEKILSLNAVGESTRLMLTGSIIVLAVLLQRKKSLT